MRPCAPQAPAPAIPAGDQPLFRLRINGDDRPVAAEPDTPLLWVLRDTLRLTGTKYGCGIARCGACTVLIDGVAIRSCVMPVSRVRGEVTTIEGLERNGALDPVQQAWLDANVPQCGYCQSGQIMATVALLSHASAPTPADVDQALGGNLCRCGTYPRIRRAIDQLVRSRSGLTRPAPSCS